MPITLTINTNPVRHETSDIGVVNTLSVLGSTIVIEDELFVGNGVQTLFTVANGPIATPGSVIVIVGNSLLVNGTNYTVAGSDIDFTGGGTPYGAPAFNDNIFITYDCSPTNYSWVLLDRPDASAAVLVPTFNAYEIQITPDVQGSYLIQVTVDNGAGSENVSSGIVSVNTLKKSISIPAAGEETELSTTKGWQAKLEDAVLKYSTGASYKHLTLGDEIGADYTAFSALLTDINADIFGIGPPSSAVFYFVDLLSDITENLAIPEGVIFNGNGFIVNTTSDVTLAGDCVLANAIISRTGGGTSSIVTTATLTERPKVLGVYTSPAYTVEVSGPVHISGLKSFPDTSDGVSVIVETALADDQALLENSIFNTVTTNGGNTHIKDCSGIGAVNITGAGIATSNLVFSNVNIDDSITIANSVTAGTFSMFGVKFSGAFTDNTLASLNFVRNYNSRLLRDTITPGVQPANTDFALTNVYYVHTGGVSPDFLNLQIYVDGLLMTSSSDPTNVTEDARPGVDGRNIQLNAGTLLATTIQVLRNG